MKVDRCFAVDSVAMIDALPATFAKYRAAMAGHSMQLSAILAGTDNPWAWAEASGVQHVRTTQDIFNTWDSVLGNLDSQEKVPGIHTFAGPGHWNDLDMLHVGTFSAQGERGQGLTLAEARSHMSLWAALKSPLLVRVCVGGGYE